MAQSHVLVMWQVLEKYGEDAWFDVGVFKVLFSEVTHYYLPLDDAPETMATSGRPTGIAEVHRLIPLFEAVTASRTAAIGRLIN